MPGSGRHPGEGNVNSLQCSCLENPNQIDRGAWWATIHGTATDSDMTEQLGSVWGSTAPLTVLVGYVG